MDDNENIMQMDCSRFEEVLHDLDRPGTPERKLREAALDHAESCSRCAQLMTDVESLDFALQQIAAHDAHLQAAPHVEANLLREFRQRNAAAQRRRMHGRLAALATAAAIVLALGLSLWRGPAFDRGAVAKVNQADGEAQNVRVEVAENRAPEAMDASAFVSLPYATDPGTLDGGTVVRVELSRSALASMGMPVTDAGSTERIPADIMLSEDGVPQAIRLVSPASLEQ